MSALPVYRRKVIPALLIENADMLDRVRRRLLNYTYMSEYTCREIEYVMGPWIIPEDSRHPGVKMARVWGDYLRQLGIDTSGHGFDECAPPWVLNLGETPRERRIKLLQGILLAIRKYQRANNLPAIRVIESI